MVAQGFRSADRLFLVSAAAFLATAALQKRHIFETAGLSITGVFTEALAVSFYLSDLFFLLALLAWLPTAPWRRLPPLAGSGALLLFLLWMFARGLSSTHPILGAAASLRTFQGIVLFLMAADIAKRTSARGAFLALIVIVGVVQSLLGTAQALQGRSQGLAVLGEPVVDIHAPGVAKVSLPGGGKFLRAYGTLPHPNVLGGVLVGTIIATHVLSRRSPSRRLRGVLTTAEVLEVLGLVLTMSRGAFLAYLTYLTIYFIRYSREFPRVVIVPFVVLTVLFSVPFFRSPILSRIFPPEDDRFLVERARLVSSSFRSLEWFLVGRGPGNTIPQYVRDVPTGTLLEPWEYDFPHALPLVVLAEGGVLGGFLFAVFLWKLLRTSSFEGRMALGIPLLVLALVDHYLWTTQQGRILFWISLGILAAQPLTVGASAPMPPGWRGTRTAR